MGSVGKILCITPITVEDKSAGAVENRRRYLAL